jgi:hypothetical protein
MRQSLFIAVWIVGCGFLALSAILFLVYKRPEVSLRDLMLHGNVYWYKNLRHVVRADRTSIIYWTAMIGVGLCAVDVLVLLLYHLAT